LQKVYNIIKESKNAFAQNIEISIAGTAIST